MERSPLVLTAALAPPEQAWLDGWRAEFFPLERNQLAAHWTGRLTRQDDQPLRPHVTVCNKVTPERARAVERELAARLVPRAFTLPGLALFAYAGGPWEPLRSFPFTG